MSKKMKRTFLEGTAMILFFIFIIPFILLVINSFKSKDAILDNPFSLSGVLETGFDNYINLFADSTINIGSAFLTSVFVTVVGLVLVVLFSSMAAWVLVRSKKWWSKIIFLMFVGSMVIPFQVIMFPLISTLSSFSKATGIETLGNVFFLPIAYLAFQSSLSIFMYHGFIKGIPKELEEAAMIDGCSRFQTFRLIILPILKPITVTVVLLNGIWLWNDYLLPQMLLLGSDTITLPIAINRLASQSYGTNYAVLLPAAVLTILPIILLFIKAQKHIIKGMVEGAVK